MTITDWARADNESMGLLMTMMTVVMMLNNDVYLDQKKSENVCRPSGPLTPLLSTVHHT